MNKKEKENVVFSNMYRIVCNNINSEGVGNYSIIPMKQEKIDHDPNGKHSFIFQVLDQNQLKKGEEMMLFYQKVAV